MNTETRKIYSISQLNTEVRAVLEEAFPPLWVMGEISNLAKPSSGHWYFSLKVENGMQVIVHGQVSLYTGRGDFQLIVDHMELAGDGALQRAFELLKQRLAAEGLFEEIHKKALPPLPKTIGVITSPTGAAVHDILNVLKRRAPNISIIVYPTAVQGTGASDQIVKALNTANRRQECDVLILARGGGSLEDLWSFNEENVARAIFASALPIISAIGHEVDFTIADWVADRRAPTPSAAAELVSPDMSEWLNKIDKAEKQLKQKMLALLAYKQQELLWMSKRLQHPGQRLQQQAQRLDLLEQMLQRVYRHLLQNKRAELTRLSHALDNISPLATLHRGYAIVTDQTTGKLLMDATHVKKGDQIIARLAEGQLQCSVEKIIQGQK
jgi:exodeoxyribonuclease VII large subunit